MKRDRDVIYYDSEGKEYLDFAAGIAVNSLGYHYPGYDEALKNQIDKLMHISNLYYNEPIIEAGAKLVKASKMSKAFFTNSGTEAIEGALKAAKKYAYVRDGHADHEIIAMNHSFHGRSIGALSVTGTAHYREPFEPLMGGVKFADFNDLESVRLRSQIRPARSSLRLFRVRVVFIRRRKNFWKVCVRSVMRKILC